jgi:toxin-antitoxin system PIN domain toxin
LACLIDTNVWVALAFPTHPRHESAASAVARCSSGWPAVFCRATQQSFLRIATTPVVLNTYGAAAMTNRDAWVVLSRFLATPWVDFYEEPPEVFAQWHDLGARATTSPKLWMDAYLAAFAIRADLQFLTLDKGFRQFKGLDLNLL